MNEEDLTEQELEAIAAALKNNPAASFKQPKELPPFRDVLVRQTFATRALIARRVPGVQVDPQRMGHMLAAIRRMLIVHKISTAAEIEYFIALEAMDLLEDVERDTRSAPVVEIGDPRNRAQRRRAAREEIQRLGRLDG